MVGAQVGDYRVLELLGVGGMGEVYRGVHTSLGRVVALKILAPSADVSASGQRFHNEARIHAAIRHPNIATLFEHVEWNGRSCLVIEYVDGETLASLLKHRGALPPELAIKYAHDVALALSYLHEHGIVHRDIKAGNVKVDSQRNVKLLDFGIARSASSPRLTQVGSIIGTMEYMAPEQLCGEPATPQTDMWALGVLLYETLTGKMPFEGEDLPSLHHKITRVGYSQASLENPQVSHAVDHVIARCLQKSPSARYSSAAELASDLQKILTQSPQSGGSPDLEREKSFDFRKRAPMLAGALAGLLLLTVVCGMIVFGGRGGTTPVISTQDPAIKKDLPSPVETEDKPNENKPDAESRPVKIDVTTGQAQIYRDGELVGETPYVLNEPLGTDMNLTLKQAGYEDQAVQFKITERKRSYSFLMEKE